MKKYLIIGIVVLVCALGGVAFWTYSHPSSSLGNVNYVAPTASTTSIAFMTPGAATTTLTYDAYSNSGATIPSKLGILVQHTASSSAGSLDVKIEESSDGLTYFGKLLAPTTITMSNPVVNYASSTLVYRLSGSIYASTTNTLIEYTPSLRFTRVQLYVPAAVNSTNGAVGVIVSPLKEIVSN